MTITELKILSEARITHLDAQRTQAMQTGDVNQILILENQIAETKATLALLNSLG